MYIETNIIQIDFGLIWKEQSIYMLTEPFFRQRDIIKYAVKIEKDCFVTAKQYEYRSVIIQIEPQL